MSTSEPLKQTTTTQKFTHRTNRNPSPQDENVRTLLYLLQAARASGGGFAAASAGADPTSRLRKDGVLAGSRALSGSHFC